MKFIVTDIETDNLLDKVSKFHCAWTKDKATGEWFGFRPDQFAEYLTYIETKAAEGYLIAFHNGIGYDHKALQILKKAYFGKNLNLPKANIFDTLVAARLIFSNIKDSDFSRARSGKLQGKLIGSHSLKAWGQRLGILKGTIGDAEEVWDVYTEEMFEYCKQDVTVTDALLDQLLKDPWYNSDPAQMAMSLRVEHNAQWTCAAIMQNGFPFNEYAAERLYQELLGKRSDLLFKLVNTFGSWYTTDTKTGDEWLINTKTGKPVTAYPRVFIPKQGGLVLKNGKKDTRDTFAGAPMTRVKFVEFNPSSRAHILKVLEDNGWVPIEFTDAGNPILNDEVLEGVHVDDPECQASIELIREFLMIQKRISQLAEGEQAWLRHVKDGKIHGYINSNGAVTGRATHSFPNIGQVPAIDKVYGPQCRDLFGAAHHVDSTGHKWIQVGTDASGIELRCLGHFLAPFDGGDYGHEVVSGDIHTKNQMAAGLPTRDNAKTFIYGWLYGAGAAKIGEIVRGGAKEGKVLQERFLEAIPAIANLKDALTGSLIKSKRYDPDTKKFVVQWKRKYIVGLDGRKVYVRSDHSALNTLLQSAGALICKTWIAEVERILVEDMGMAHGWDGDFAIMAYVHDELQIACREQSLADKIHEVSAQAMTNTEKYFNFRVALAVESKTGATWKDCH